MSFSLPSLSSPETKWILLSSLATSLLAIHSLSLYLKKNSNQVKLSSPPPTPQEMPTPHIYLERPYSTQDHPIKSPEHFPLYKICLTGGPCAGKTTSLSVLSQKLTEKGFRVFTVPEVPTLTKQGGGMIMMAYLSQESIIKFQTFLMRLQMKMEDYFTELAILSDQPSIVLCDRGVIDPYAYMDEGCWSAILDSQSWNMVQLRDKRYDAVVHLVTAADGAEEFYSSNTNEARYEDVDTAKRIDKRTQRAWIGHPKLYIVDNSFKGFEEKINKVYSLVARSVGLPLPELNQKKYLLSDFKIPEDIKEERFTVEITYLKSEDLKERKLRKRTQNNLSKYTYSVKTRNPEGESVETLKELSARNYQLLLEQKDEFRKFIIKERRCFIWEHQSFVIDTIVSCKDKTQILRIDGIEEDFHLKLPPFCAIVREVSNDRDYSNLKFSERSEERA